MGKNKFYFIFSSLLILFLILENNVFAAPIKPTITWTGRTANDRNSVKVVPISQFSRLKWSDLSTIPLNDTNVWNGNGGTFANWTYFGNGMQLQRFHGYFTLPSDFNPSQIYAFQNIDPATHQGYSVSVDNEMICFVYPFIDQNNDGINDMTDGDLSNYEITDNNFMSYFSFYAGTGQAAGIYDFNGVPNGPFGPYDGIGFWCNAPIDNTGTIITATLAAYPNIPIDRWEIDLYGCDWGTVGGFPKGDIVTEEAQSTSTVVINYYYDKIDPANRIGFYTDKTKSVGYQYVINAGTSEGQLDYYLATAKAIGQSNNYLSGVQTEGTLIVEAGLNTINVLYTKQRDADVIVHYQDDKQNTIANDLIGTISIGITLDETGTIIVKVSGVDTPVQIKKDIKDYNYYRTSPITTITGNNELTLVYKKESCVVNFDINNVDYSGSPINSQVIDVHTSINITPSLNNLVVGTRYENHGNKKFLGWFKTKDNPSDAIPVDLSSLSFSTNTTLYARWQQYYKVSFANVLTNVVNDQDVLENDYANEPSIISPTSFTFYGWSANPNALGTGIVGLNDEPFDFANTAITSNITIYAIWNPITYTISFDPNGGNWNSDTSLYLFEYVPANKPIGTISGCTSPYEFVASLNSPNDPSRIGYDFIGWKDANGIDISNETNASKAYYAQWKVINYDINYVLDGGINHPNNASQYNKEDHFPISIEEPSKLGYVFKGWMATNEDSSWQQSLIIPLTIPNGVIGNLTITAYWEPIIYTIDYVLNGGINSEDNPTTYNLDTNAPISIINPTREGYTFIGWTIKNEDNTYALDTPIISYSIPKNVMGNLVLTAHWKANKSDNPSNIESAIPSTGNDSLFLSSVCLSLCLIGLYYLKKITK